MAKTPQTRGETCPVARSVDLLGDRWSLLIVRDAFDGTCRFGDFQQDLGVARSVLSDRLKRLLEAGILQIGPASDGTAYQEYRLTEKGQSLFPLVVALRQWGERFLFEAGEARSQLVETGSGQALALMQPLTAEGRVIAADETRVLKPQANSLFAP